MSMVYVYLECTCACWMLDLVFLSFLVNSLVRLVVANIGGGKSNLLFTKSTYRPVIIIAIPYNYKSTILILRLQVPYILHLQKFLKSLLDQIY